MERVFNDSDDDSINDVKAAIITSVTRKMSTLLSLTKSQNEQLLSFWKTMIVFVHQQSAAVTKKVKASYNSRVRQTLRDEQERKQMCQRYMQDCCFFSIAIDSSLIRSQHLFSCFVRFSFEDRIVQTPLFFEVLSASTGNGIAELVFNKILEHGVQFEKLVSVSTDGAGNMVGRLSGMTRTLKELIRQHCRHAHVPFNKFHSVWCMAHRLNLVTRDFLDSRGIFVDKAFCDWVSDRRRQATYKLFLSETNVREQLKTIPQPSDTRWLFY